MDTNYSLIKVSAEKFALQPIRDSVKAFTIKTLLLRERCELICWVFNCYWAEFCKTLKELSGELSTQINYAAADDIYTSM